MKKFNELDITNEVMQAIDQIGHQTATLVQEKAIPALKKGDDIVILSQTGSGKTLAFGVPAIESIDPEINAPQVLIICPTRELATQVTKEIKLLSNHVPGVKPFSIYGGQPIFIQIKGLKSKPNLIVGTPGRIKDHIKRRTLKLETVKMLILDEADEMLKMGFREDIEEISKKLAGKRQGVLASATMSKEIKNLTNKFLNNPITIDAGNANSPAKSIHQEYVALKQKNKKQVLLDMLNNFNNTALIFCNTKRMTTTLFKYLKDQNFDVREIHGDMRQGERTKNMNAFKSGKAQILVATDVAARGIDVNNISCVINYDYPDMQEYYIHRIGRTGRAGNKGTAYTFITSSNQMNDLQQLSKRLEFTVENSDYSSDIKFTKSTSSNKSNKNFNSRNKRSNYRKGSNNRSSSRNSSRDSNSNKSKDNKKPYNKKRDDNKTSNKDNKKPYGKKRDDNNNSKKDNKKPYIKRKDENNNSKDRNKSNKRKFDNESSISKNKRKSNNKNNSKSKPKT
jgi:ATP-dependent RNA helicase DeaD